MKKINLAIVGATGLVGQTFLKVLEERQFPIDNLYLFASKKSAGKEIHFLGKNYIVEELNEDSFKKDIDANTLGSFFCAKAFILSSRPQMYNK